MPGTLTESKLQRKSRQTSNFKSYHVQKTRLADWNLNAPSTNALPGQSLTTITHGMSTSQTPLRLLDMAHTMETGIRGESGFCVVRTAQQYTLDSPIPLSRRPLHWKNLMRPRPSSACFLSGLKVLPCKLKTTIWIFASDSEIQAPTPAGLSVTTALDTLLLPLLIPGDLSSSSGLLIEDQNMDIDPKSLLVSRQHLILPSSSLEKNLPSSSGWAEHQDSASNDQIEPEIDVQAIVPRLQA